MDIHPPQGAHTSYLRTLSKIKGLRELLVSRPRTFRRREPRTIQPFSFPSTPRSEFFSFRDARPESCIEPRHPPRRTCCRRAANPTTKLGFVNPSPRTFFHSAEGAPAAAEVVVSIDPPLQGRASYIQSGIRQASARNFFRAALERRSATPRRPGGHARTRACRSATDARRRARASARDPPPRHRRCARRAR